MEDKILENGILEQEAVELDLEAYQALLGSAQVQRTAKVSEFINEPFELDEEEFDKIQNSKEYEEGLKIASKYGCIYSVLVRLGVDVETAGTIAINQQTLDYNLRQQELVNKGYEYQQNLTKQTQL